MIRNNIILKKWLPGIAFILSGVVTGCIKEDLAECPKSYQLVVRTDEGDNVSQDGIKEVILFIFDENQRYINSISTSVDKVVELNYPSHNNLTVVGWANTVGTNQTQPSLTPGMPLEGQQITLVNLAIARLIQDDNYTLSPNDLFHGIKQVDLKNGSNTTPDVLYIKRKVSAVSIIARHLQEYMNTQDQDFSYRLRKSKNALDFTGLLTGTEVSYLPQATFNTKNEFETPVFLILPSEMSKSIEVDIYKGTQLVHTITSTPAGEPIQAVEGKFLQIIVDFSGGINIEINLSDWENKDVSGEF